MTKLLCFTVIVGSTSIKKPQGSHSSGKSTLQEHLVGSSQYASLVKTEGNQIESTSRLQSIGSIRKLL